MDIIKRLALNRRDCFNRFDDDCDDDNFSSFYIWGRWVLLGAIIFVVLVLLLSCTCLARRRRSRGVQPMYGTGWLAGGNKYNTAYPQQYQQYPMNNYGGGYGGGGYANPPPAYGQQREQQQQYTGSTFNPNDGYYGNNYNSGVTNPPATYDAPPTKGGAV